MHIYIYLYIIYIYAVIKKKSINIFKVKTFRLLPLFKIFRLLSIYAYKYRFIYIYIYIYICFIYIYVSYVVYI